MATRKDCIDEILEAMGGRASRERVMDELGGIDDRAQGYEAEGMSKAESYQRARDERLDEISQQRALQRRAERLDAIKTIERHRYYAKAPDMATGLEAKIVGVNAPFEGNRLSVDAQHMSLAEDWLGGFALDLERAGLLKLFASRTIEKDWARELFEINKGQYGKPGVTGNEAAKTIAEAIHRWQKVSIAAINREGGWVRTYSGYITRTSHDADAIRRAGPMQWASDTLPRLDLKRTFGTIDRQRAAEALREMFKPMANGDHFDYGRRIGDEPIYPNVAKQASASRELHFKSADDWLAYNEQYGAFTPTQTVVRAYDTAAQRTALLREFGTRPREAFEQDINYIKASLQRHLSATEQGRFDLLSKKEEDLTAAEQAELAGIKTKLEAFTVFDNREHMLRNWFAQVDGSSMRPVNRTAANVIAGYMAVQRMAKLGRVALTHFASLPTKVSELRYWGIPLSERIGSLVRGLTRGTEGSEKREALDLLHAGLSARVGYIAARYDHADTPRGVISRMENHFFRLTGINAVVDNQRGEAEAMMARWLGMKRGQDWTEVGANEQRVLQGFGVGEAEWNALHQAEWTKLGENTYLMPSDARKLSDEAVRTYLIEKKPIRGAAEEPTAAAIDKAREDLALRLATAYNDRGRYAIIMSSAKTRGYLYGAAYQPGSNLNMALKLLYQFKIWPAEMINRTFGREIYGRAGDPTMGRVGALVELMVGSIIFGTASEAVREALQGKDPVAKLRERPVAALTAGLVRSGAATIAGDYLLGQYDRHGFSAVASLAGPTFGQIDTLMDMLHGGGERSAHPYRTAAADALKVVHDNAPFMNLWATGWAFDHLVLHELQEWMNPGYLQRAQKRMEQQQGVHFLVSPQRIHEQLHGH